MREIAVTHDSENVPKDTREEHEFTKLLKEEIVAHAADVDRSSDGFDKSVNHSSQENEGIIQRKPGIAQLNTMYDRYIFITHY